jgi:hypothetical protein
MMVRHIDDQLILDDWMEEAADYLKKALTNQYTGHLNDGVTRHAIRMETIGYVELNKIPQIDYYKTICDDSNNTPEIIDANCCVLDLYVYPVAKNDIRRKAKILMEPPKDHNNLRAIYVDIKEDYDSMQERLDGNVKPPFPAPHPCYYCTLIEDFDNPCKYCIHNHKSIIYDSVRDE